ADLHLPPIKVMIRKDGRCSRQEQDFYQSLYMQSRVRFDTYVESGTILHNYAHIFDLLTSLRRAVDHPYLIVHGVVARAAPPPAAEDGTARPQAALHDICGLCQDDIAEDPVLRRWPSVGTRSTSTASRHTSWTPRPCRLAAWAARSASRS
ncbi:unnamed protein product, partial [Prorocentrum cordatum]